MEGIACYLNGILKVASVLTISVSLSGLTLNPTLLAQTKRTAPARQLQQLEPVSALPGKAKRWALVIGVDKYRDPQISQLRGSDNDARTVADALIRYAGFPSDQVILMSTDQPDERQPTRVNILRRLSNLASIVPKDGLYLISFAGHGIERNGQAYLLPSDAQISEDVSFLEETAVSVARMKERIRATGVGQVIIMLDACRNDPGGRADAPNPLSQAYVSGFNFDVHNREVNAFAILYATDVGQRAYEYTERHQGYFSWAVVEGLKGGAANGKGEITLAGLVKYIQETVPKRISIDLGGGKQQKPFAVIEGYRADELVIAVAGQVSLVPETSAPASPTETDLFSAAGIYWDTEVIYWDSIKNSTSSEDFNAYLQKYPNGQFANLARIRVAGLAVLSGKTEPATEPKSTIALREYDFDWVTLNPTGEVKERRKGRARYFTENLGGGVSLEMVEIPGGSFLMGSPASEAGRSNDEGPQHSVSVKSFYLGKFEVTQAQWRAVAKLPIINRRYSLGSDPSKFKGDALPIERVSWEDAMEFCARLSRATGREYRLATEAEWEYAARAGTTTPFVFGDTITPEFANYNGEQSYAGAPKGLKRGRTMPVGSLSVANGFGLFDMHGNVWEWVLDSCHNNYDGAPSDGTAWDDGRSAMCRMYRGGSWDVGGEHCRSADRNRRTPTNLFDNLGFRVVLASAGQ